MKFNLTIKKESRKIKTEFGKKLNWIWKKLNWLHRALCTPFGWQMSFRFRLTVLTMSGCLRQHRSGSSVDQSTLSLRSLCASVIIISAVISTQAEAKALLFLIEKPVSQTGMKLSSRVVILRNIRDDGKLFLSVSQLFFSFSAVYADKMRGIAGFGLSLLVSILLRMIPELKLRIRFDVWCCDLVQCYDILLKMRKFCHEL